MGMIVQLILRREIVTTTVCMDLVTCSMSRHPHVTVTRDGQVTDVTRTCVTTCVSMEASASSLSHSQSVCVSLHITEIDVICCRQSPSLPPPPHPFVIATMTF